MAALALAAVGSPAAVLAPFLAASDGTLALVGVDCAPAGCLAARMAVAAGYATGTAMLAALAAVWVGSRVGGAATGATDQ